MGTPANHAQLDAFKQRIELAENFLRTVVRPQDELLQAAIREYLESCETAPSWQDRVPLSSAA